MSSAHALTGGTAPRQALRAWVQHATARRGRSLDWLLQLRRPVLVAPEARSAPGVPAAPDEDQELLRRLREAGL